MCGREKNMKETEGKRKQYQFHPGVEKSKVRGISKSFIKLENKCLPKNAFDLAVPPPFSVQCWFLGTKVCLFVFDVQ